MHIARLIPTVFPFAFALQRHLIFILGDYMTLGGQHLCKHDGDVYIQTFIISYLLETADPSCLDLEFFLSRGDLILEMAVSDFQMSLPD